MLEKVRISFIVLQQNIWIVYANEFEVTIEKVFVKTIDGFKLSLKLLSRSSLIGFLTKNFNNLNR